MIYPKKLSYVSTHPDFNQLVVRYLLSQNNSFPNNRPLNNFHSTLDWKELLKFATDNRIAPLLGYYLEGKDLLPYPMTTELHKKYLSNVWRNHFFLEELQNILRLFEEEGVSVILLKGAALIHTVYPKIGLRPLGDLDLLVRAENFDRAREILAPLAREMVGALPQTPAKFVKEVTFILKSSGAAIDLHATITSPPHSLTHGQLDWFWKNSRDIKVGQFSAKVFAPEAQILHLCSHMVHHFGGDLLDRYDLHELIRLNSTLINWDILVNTAQKFDMLIPLQKVLPELAEEWGTPIPSFILTDLDQLVPSTREQRIFRDPYGRESRNAVRRILLEFTSHKSVNNAIQYAWFRLFPLPSFMKKYYGAKNVIFLPFSYFYRWCNCILRKEETNK